MSQIKPSKQLRKRILPRASGQVVLSPTFFLFQMHDVKKLTLQISKIRQCLIIRGTHSHLKVFFLGIYTMQLGHTNEPVLRTLVTKTSLKNLTRYIDIRSIKTFSKYQCYSKKRQNVSCNQLNAEIHRHAPAISLFQ